MQLPQETLNCDGVTLRRWRLDDAGALCRNVVESLDHLAPWMAWVADGYTSADAETFVARCQTDWQSGAAYNYAIIAPDGALAGSCGLMSRIAPGGLEIGYWLHPRYTGQGVATRAAAALTAEALRIGADPVEIKHDAANERSGAVAQRLGFIQETRVPARGPLTSGEVGVDVVWRTRAAPARPAAEQDTTPVEVAEQLVAERFPEAVAAFLGGSVITAARTATSDLDIVVIRPDGYPVYRETLHHAGWPVELFVNTPTSYQGFLDREIAHRRSPLLHMVGLGVIVRDIDGTAGRLRADAHARIRTGPPPATQEQIEDLRYGVSDLLDDLDGATEPDEIAVIAAALLTATGTLALTTHGSWLGAGKWLSRRFKAVDPELHAELMTAFQAAVNGDPQRLRSVTRKILESAGGRLLEGYHRDAPADPPHDAVPN